MENSIEKIPPAQVNHFLKKLCMVAARHSQKHDAVKKLQTHIQKLKKHSNKKEYSSDLEVLQERIGDLVQSQKKIKYYQQQDHLLETRLKERVAQLEDELADQQKALEHERTEKEKAIEHNEKKIQVLTKSLSKVKSEVHQLVEEKKEKKKRLTDLEKKISKRSLHRR